MVLIFIILSACSGTSPQAKIYEHLEKAVSLEEGFEEQQDEITALEKQEQQIYSQIIELDMSEFEQVKELSQEAIDIIKQRSDKITLEQESISASREEFEKIDDLINEDRKSVV